MFMFCKTSFLASRHCMDASPSGAENINNIKISNGVYDDLYISKENKLYNEENLSIPTEWQTDTVLHAKFNGSLNAGSVDFVLSQISSIVIKKQMVGDNTWENIEQRFVTTPDECIFTINDRYVRSGVQYRYALVPVYNGIEGDSYYDYITPEFEGIFILGQINTDDNIADSYHAVANIRMSTSKNRPSAVINTIDSPYPYVVTNGQNNYYSGSTSALFVRTDKDAYDWQFYDSWKYREELMDFLCDGKPKILKHFDGRMYLIGVIDNPTQDENTSNYYPITTFNWVEIGDADSTLDLYTNSLKDYNGVIAVSKDESN